MSIWRVVKKLGWSQAIPLVFLLVIMVSTIALVSLWLETPLVVVLIAGGICLVALLVGWLWGLYYVGKRMYNDR